MDTMTVPKFRLEFDEAFIARFRCEAGKILRSDFLAEGPWVRRFEREFAQFIGCRHAVATSSGTTALEVALRSVGVAGKEVIVPTNTFIATAIAVERAGGILKLVDIEPDTYAADPDRIAEAVNENTGAVVVVHIGGTISKYIERIVYLCNETKIPLVEDAAHAHGARRGDYRAGTIGQVAAFSFFPTKVMTTGEGGMVTTNDDDIAGHCHSIKNFGRFPVSDTRIYRPGLNAHMTEFQGLMGVMDLERLPQRWEERFTLAGEYGHQMGWAYHVGESSNYKFIVRTKAPASQVREYCRERGVDLAGGVYEVPLHQQPVYEGRFDPAGFPVANEFCAHHICPPLYPEMTVEDVHYVCEVLKAAEKELA